MSIRIRRKICHQLTLKCWPHPIVCVLMSLLMLSSFVILQMKVESIVILGNVSDELSWLKNVNYLSNFLHPGVKSELLLPRDINSLGQRDEVACFVMSSPGNSLARSAIRRTWGKKMKPIFIMGISDSNTMNSIKNEAELFDDIIVENFFDSYLNLTIKTAFALKHFTRHFSQSKYFFKIDDDVFLNVENLHKFLRHESTPKNSIIGRQGIAVSPHRERESKWYIPRWMFSSEKLPPYIDGPAYLIPGTFHDCPSNKNECPPYNTVCIANILLEISLYLSITHSCPIIKKCSPSTFIYRSHG